MAKTKGESRKLIWLMMLLVVISSGAAAAAIYLVLRGDEPASQASVEVAPEPVAPIFVEIDPFTVNLADDDYGSRLLYTGMSLKVGNAETRDVLREHMPQVRSRLLILFSGQKAPDLTGQDGKERLAGEVIAVLDRPMTAHQPELAIEEVLFTEFIVQ